MCDQCPHWLHILNSNQFISFWLSSTIFYLTIFMSSNVLIWQKCHQLGLELVIAVLWQAVRIDLWVTVFHVISLHSRVLSRIQLVGLCGYSSAAGWVRMGNCWSLRHNGYVIYILSEVGECESETCHSQVHQTNKSCEVWWATHRKRSLKSCEEAFSFRECLIYCVLYYSYSFMSVTMS